MPLIAAMLVVRVGAMIANTSVEGMSRFRSRGPWWVRRRRRGQRPAGWMGEELFRGLLETAPDAMVIVDEAGEIVLVNSQTEQLFGYRRDELVGRRVEMLMPQRYRERHAGHRDGFFASPTTRPMESGLELYVRCRDGREPPVEISLSPLVSERGNARLGGDPRCEQTFGGRGGKTASGRDHRAH